MTKKVAKIKKPVPESDALENRKKVQERLASKGKQSKAKTTLTSKPPQTSNENELNQQQIDIPIPETGPLSTSDISIQPLDKYSAKQMCYAWRIILTSLHGEGLFHDDIPTAFTAQMGTDGSLYLEPYRLEPGVTFVSDEEPIDMPAPIQHTMQSISRSSSPSPPAAGSGNPSRPIKDAMVQKRSHRRRGGGPRPTSSGVPVDASKLRVISSNDGDAEIIE